MGSDHVVLGKKYRVKPKEECLKIDPRWGIDRDEYWNPGLVTYAGRREPYPYVPYVDRVFVNENEWLYHPNFLVAVELDTLEDIFCEL